MKASFLTIQLFSGEKEEFEVSDKNEIKINDISVFLVNHYRDALLQYEMFFVFSKSKNADKDAFKITKEGNGKVSYLDRILNVLNKWFTGDRKDTTETMTFTEEEKELLKQHSLIIIPSLSFISTKRYTPRPRTGAEAVSIHICEPSKHTDNITDYYKALDEEAALLKYKPHLQVPVEPEVLVSHSASRITFLAFDDNENRIVGFCSCIISRYRHEFEDEIKRLVRKTLKDDKKVEDNKIKTYPKIDTRDLKKRPKGKLQPVAPFYFGVDEKKQKLSAGQKIKCVYDIDSLSVLSSKTGKNIGLTLLYHAFLFITAESQRTFYPVTHFVSYSASARTLRFLRDTFQFKYYGENVFFNENFVWTLSNDQKELCVKQIESLLEVYQIIFKYLEDKKQKNKITEAGELFFALEERIKLKDMLVSLYQLYLLIIQSVIENPKQSTVAETELNYFSATIFARFEALFDIFALKKPIKGTDAHYETFYLYDYSEVLNLVVKDPDLNTEKDRFTYHQCYDILYRAIETTASPVLQENTFLKSSKKILNKIDERTNEVAKELNAVLLNDLKEDYNYQLPFREISPIIDSLSNIDFYPDADLSNEKFDLLDALWKKKSFLGQYATIYDAIFQSAFDSIKGESEDTRFDTFIEFDAFLKVFPVKTTELYNQKIARNEPTDNPPVASQSDSQSIREKGDADLIETVKNINKEEESAAAEVIIPSDNDKEEEEAYIYDYQQTVAFFFNSLGHEDSVLNVIRV